MKELFMVIRHNNAEEADEIVAAVPSMELAETMKARNFDCSEWEMKIVPVKYYKNEEDAKEYLHPASPFMFGFVELDPVEEKEVIKIEYINPCTEEDKAYEIKIKEKTQFAYSQFENWEFSKENEVVYFIAPYKGEEFFEFKGTIAKMVKDWLKSI